MVRLNTRAVKALMYVVFFSAAIHKKAYLSAC